MKKLYSLLAVVAVSMTATAQVVLTENFASYTKGGNTGSSGSTAPDSVDMYNPSGTNPIAPVSNFPTGDKVYSAGGMAKLGSSSAPGTMTSKELDLSTNGGNVKVTFDVKGWTNVEGPMVVTLSGQTPKEVTYTAVMSGNAQKVTAIFTGGTAASTVTIATKTKRAYVDNVTIETYDITLATGDINATKVNLVKNTVIANEIIFGQEAKVSVINMAGQVVKTAEVKDNSRLDVSNLAKGTYIVAATVNGKAVSQKVIKK